MFFMGKSMTQGLGPVVAFQVFPATPTKKTGYNGWNPRNGETHVI
jgi:hypothetical protein